MPGRRRKPLRTIAVVLGLLGAAAPSSRAEEDFPDPVAASRRLRERLRASRPGAPAAALTTPLFSYDSGSIAVMEHDGSDYSRSDSDGVGNYLPRAALAQRFYETHGDNYDFLVVFTDFEFETGGATAFYNLVRRSDKGIGRFDDVDNGLIFGSPGRLKGYIDMAALPRYAKAPWSLDSESPGFFSGPLHVLAHEVGHQWLAQPRFQDPSGGLSSDLLGRDGVHWSYLLDSDASHMYGSDWVLRPDGQYEAQAIRETYSALDLYLMGFLAPAQVGPITLLRNPLIDTTALPREGDAVLATPQAVSVADIVAAEGARVPDHLTSQKEYRVGFVFLAAPGAHPKPADLEAVERIRQAFPAHFFAQTRGVALVDTSLAEAPAPTPLPAPDLALALGFLVGNQAADGRWEDWPGTGARDTAAVLQALLEAGEAGNAYEKGLGWLSPFPVANLDFAARRALVLAPRLPVAEKSALAASLVALQGPDGGWGAAEGYASDALDTALVLRALRALGNPADLKVAKGIEALATHRLTGGGWPFVPGGEASTVVTAEVLLALVDWHEVAGAQAQVPAAVTALSARRNPDGGFGESPSTPYATALSVAALFRAGAGEALLADALSWLQQNQLADGSWGGRRYDTALVLSALKGGSAPNLVVPADSLVLSPDTAVEGDVVQVAFKVRNSGKAPAGPSTVRLFVGAPTGEPVAEAPVPALAPEEEWPLTLPLTTEDRAGTLQVFVAADGRHDVAEWREDDNVATRALQVEGLLADLVVEPAGMSTVPDPAVAGEPVQVSVLVRNLGEDRSGVTALHLVLGHPQRGGTVVAQVEVPPVEPLGQVVVSLPWDTTGLLGPQVLYAVADPGFVEPESDETNNQAAVVVEVEAAPPPGADLSVSSVLPQPSAFTTIPQALTVVVKVKNRGLTAATTSVALYDGDPASSPVVSELPVTLGPRSSAILSFPYEVTAPGTRTLHAVVDPLNLIAEERENDNHGQGVLADPQNTLDVAIPPAGVTLSATSLTVAETLTVTAQVRNQGTVAFAEIPVGLFRTAGGAELARTTVSLGPGEQATVSLAWVTGVAGDPLDLTLRGDPFDLLGELDESNNTVPLAVTVQPSTLPNLKVSGTDIVIAPEPPLEGGSATVSIVVKNTGVVPAGAFTVQFFRGDPDQGGDLIDTASVPGLAGAASTTTAITWSPVSARGLAGLVVIADAAAQVEEFDESDNRAFRPLTAIGLPDLSIAAAEVSFAPAFPHAGQSVSVTAVLRNLGARPSLATVVRAVGGEPGSGSLLSEIAVPPLPPGGGFDLSFPWTPAGEGERTLSLLADPDQALAEADEGNNLARRVVVIQNADLYLTAPYFSPNGDGVQDETSLAWRATGPVSVVVSNARGQKVRTLAESAPAEGSVTWDGRNDEGRMLFDGSYTLSLIGEGGALGRAVAVLDTNRSPIHNAAGTRRVASQNLTCTLGEFSGPAFLPSEEAALFVVGAATAPDRPVGLVRVDLGGDYEYLFADPWYASVFVPSPAAVSPDGRFLIVTGFDGRHRVDLVTGERMLLPSAASHGSKVSWSPDGSAFLAMGTLYTRDGAFVGSPGGDWAWSPDGRYLANGLTVMKVDLSESWTLALPDVYFEWIGQTDWLPDGRIFTVLQESGEGGLGTDECVLGCPIFYTPFVDGYERFPLNLSGGSWSPEADRFLFNRYQVSTSREVTSVVRRDGTGLLDLFGGFVAASPRGSLGYYFDNPEPGSACFGLGSYDIVALLNLDNLSVDVRAARLPGDAGLLLKGIAADRNLDHWQLDYASLATPETWLPLGPAFEVPILDDVLMPWVPPSPGTYAVRLRAWDRAGNLRAKTRLVAWDKTPTIANLAQDEFLISPNGDGVKDAVTFSYLAQVPTLVGVQVFGPEPVDATVGPAPLVRSFAFEHRTAESQVFAWDGRDEASQVVPDGLYSVVIEGLPFRVEVDTTPPDAGWSWADVRSEATPSGGVLFADRLWHVLDANLKTWTATLEPGKTVLQGNESVYEPERDALGDPVYERGLPKPKYEGGELADVREPEDGIAQVGVHPGASFAATDHAGNVSVAPILPVLPRLYLLAAMDTGSSPPAVRIAPPVTEATEHLLPQRTTFVLGETLVGNPPEGETVRFQYQPEAGGPFAEVPFQSFGGGASWSADFADLGLDLAGAYKGRFACDTPDGSFSSEGFRFRPCDRYGRLDLVILLGHDPPLAIFTASGYAATPLVSAELVYAPPGKEIVRRPLLPDGPNRFTLTMPVAALEGACSVSAILTAADGSKINDDQSACRRLEVFPPCGGGLGVTFKETGECGKPNQYRFDITENGEGLFYVVEGDPETAPFEIARFVGPPRERGPWFTHHLVTDVTLLPDRALPIRVTVYETEGGAKLNEFRFLGHVDKTPVVAEVFRPVDGEALCVSKTLGIDSVRFTARGRDNSSRIVVGLALRREGGAFTDLPRICTAGDETCAEGRIPKNVILDTDWDVRGLEGGELDARMSFCDAAGNRTLVDRKVFLRREPPYVAVLSANRRVFSPNGDGQADTTTVAFRLAEALKVTARVRGDGPGGPVVRNFFTNSLRPQGDFDVLWDGGSDSGLVLPDGKYWVEVAGADACGQDGSVGLGVEIDNTPPVATIALPTPLASVFGSTDVVGVASDLHLKSWQLESRPAGGAFGLIASRGFGVGSAGTPGLLSRWDTPAFVGPYDLRLTVTDAAENASQALVPVVVEPRARLERLGAEPALFSPNGDGRRETTTLEYALKAPARVRLQIRTIAGMVLRTLENQIEHEAGTYAFAWDGRDDAAAPIPDGEYRALVVAEDPAAPGGPEQIAIAVEVDRTPPALSVDTPSAEAFVDRSTGVQGSVTDKNIASWFLTATSAGGAIVEVAGGVQDQPTGELGSLSLLAEGGQTLTLRGEDAAENRSEKQVPFTIDSIPPVASFETPLPGTFWPRSAPVNVLGTTTDANLLDWKLFAGRGESPAAFYPVRSAAVGGTGMALGPWAVGSLPDDDYTLKLVATDRAGHTTEALVGVVLDGTPPTVNITGPQEGKYVTAVRSIDGTAADLHLDTWELAAAPGPAATAYQWTPLHSDTAGVSASALAPWNPLPPDGTHTLRLTARDQAGNEASVLRTVIVDTTPPAAPQPTAVVERTSSTEARIVLTWPPNGEADLAGYRVSRAGQTLTGLIQPPTWPDPGRADGVYEYEVVAEDLAGNVSAPGTVEVKVNLAPPTAEITSPAAGATVSGTVPVRGTAWSHDDFKEYRLSVGGGLAPAAFALLRRSTLPVQAGTLAEWTALGDGPHVIRLEAEDTYGNLARVDRPVVIDNQPPLPPVLTVVEVAGPADTLREIWTASPSPDVVGYLVYRNGRVANAPGITLGSLQPYLVPGPSHLDPALPDGEHCYRIAAMDAAGNQSPPSNQLCQTLENRAPVVDIVDPPGGQRFEFPLQVVAFTPDLDVVSVQFRIRPHAEPPAATAPWQDLGPADTQEPWATTLDPTVLGLSYGPYDLSAVAQDGVPKTGTASPVKVVYGDTTPPAAPQGLVAKVDGHAIRLTWQANTEPDIAGYHVYHQGTRLTTDPVRSPAYDDERDPGTYPYTVTAMDADGNQSGPSAPAEAIVYAVVLEQPFPVTLASQAIVRGTSRPDTTVDVFRDGLVVGSTPAATAAFQVDVSLQPDVNQLSARGRDALDNRSIPSEEIVVIGNTAPGPVADLTATLGPAEVTVTWTAPPDGDLFGYVLRRDEAPLLGSTDQHDAAAISASSTAFDGGSPEAAFDEDPTSVWRPEATDLAPAWTVTFASPLLIEKVGLAFAAPGGSPLALGDYAIDALWEGRYLRLAGALGNTAAEVEHVLPSGFATQEIRVRVEAGSAAGLAEVRITRAELLYFPAGPFVDSAPLRDGPHTYEVAAVDRYGAYGPWTSVVADVDRLSKPTGLVAVADGSDAVLTWNPNPEPNIDHYIVYRFEEEIGNPVPPFDRDPSLPNGGYVYRVRARGTEGNESELSDPAPVTILVQPPVAPVLQAVATAQGSVQLTWTHPGAARYVLSRSTTAGGPHTPLVTVTALAFLDTAVTAGVEYFYLVRAQDAAGNPSPVSNEASATPERTQAPEAPVILLPTDAAHPIERQAPKTDVRGRTEPKTEVSLTVNGDSRGSVPAREPFATDLVTTLDREPLAMLVSPDRRRVVYQSYDPDLGVTDVRLRDVATATTLDLRAALAPPNVLLSFSPDSRQLLYLLPGTPSDQNDLGILDLETGDITIIEDGPDSAYDGAWSGDGTKLAYVTASAGADCQLFAKDLVSGTTDPLDAGVGCPFDLQWSRDGSRIGFTAQSGSAAEVRLLTLGQGPASVIASSAYGARFTPDGRALYVDEQAGRIRSYDPATGAYQDLTDDSSSPFDLVVDPQGRWFSTLNSLIGAVRVDVTSLVSGERRTVRETSAGGPWLHDWTEDGSLLLATADGREVTTHPGYASFSFGDVLLTGGPNVLVARATDPASSLESPDSEPVQVSVPATLFSDPAVTAAEMGSYPAAPAVDQPATLWARVRNLGASSAEAVSVRLRLVDPQGDIVAESSFVLGTLPAGGDTVVALPWVPAASGAFGLRVIVDPLNSILELSEANNVAVHEVVVPGAEGFLASLDADRTSYPSLSPALVTVRLANGKGSVSFGSRLTVETVAGAAVAVLDERDLTLVHGEATEYTVDWNTGTVYAGDYVFRVRVLEGGAPTTSAERPFTIQPDVQASAKLVADHFRVSEGEAATFEARIRNDGKNAVLDGTIARFSVQLEAAPGTVVYETLTPLPALLPAGAQTWSAGWPSALPAGAYRAALQALRGGQVLAMANAPFEVAAAAGQLAGTITSQPGHVLQGAPFETPLTVTNVGEAPLGDTPLVVEVVSGPTATVHLTEALSAALGPGESTLASPQLSSASLPPGEYVVRLRADSSAVSLARAPLRVHGLITPPSIDSPADGSVVDTPLPVLTVNNASSAEGAALSYEFALFADIALATPLPGITDVPEAPARTSWALEEPLSEDSTYWWRARARDAFSTSAWSAVAKFTVDAVNQPPDSPVPDSPRGEATVATRQPLLVVRNAQDAENDVLTYDFRLAKDEGLVEIVATTTGVAEGFGLTSWLVPVLLEENTRYCWASRAQDAKAFSSWSLPTCFVVDTENTAPSAPVPLRPIGGAHVATLTPELVVGPAQDPEGAPLTYRFEIDRTASFASPDLQVSPEVPGGGPEMAWTPPSALADNTDYFWRAAASDGVTQGPWAYAAFFVNLGNDAPLAPVLLDPVDGVTVTTTTPLLLWRNARDADGDPLSYESEVRDATGTVVAAAFDVAEGTLETSWTVPSPLAENATFQWRVRARDAKATGPWSEPETFHVNALRQPPTAPTPILPAEGALVADRHPALVVENAQSPDGLSLTYTFELYAETSTGLTLVEAATAVPEGSGSTAFSASPSLGNGDYAWRVRAFDGELFGPWSDTARFRVAVDEPPAPPLGLVATPGDAKVMLSWQAGAELDVVAYRVYRSLTAGGPHDFLAEVLAPTHTDQGLINGVTYHYVVTALDATHESGPSNEAAATPFAPPTVLLAEVRLTPEKVGLECLIAPCCDDDCDGDDEDDDRPSPGDDHSSGHGDHDDDSDDDDGDDDGDDGDGDDHAGGCPRYVAARIELPAGHAASSIDRGTVRLAGSVAADPQYHRIEDGDGDGLEELEVRFASLAVAPLLHAGMNTLGITGQAAGIPFQGSDAIEVEELAVELEISPNPLKRAGGGPDVLAAIELPECLTASSISVASLRLDATVPVKKVVKIEGNELTVRFARAAVLAVLPNGTKVEVRVTGTAAGQAFVAKDHIKVTP